MKESLKAKFSKSQIELAATLSSGGVALRQAVENLFADQAMLDPLLSAEEVQALLASNQSIEAVRDCLDELVTTGSLEKSSSTTRALDKEGTTLFRKKGAPISRLRVLGMASTLSDGSKRYQFTVDGRIIRSIARIDRLDAVAGKGNQRNEVVKHVEEIAKGIKAGVQVPNSILLVFQADTFTIDPDPNEPCPSSWAICRNLSEASRVPHPLEHDKMIQTIQPIELDLPYRPAAFDDEKVALLVDGQQRTAALSIVDIDEVPSFSFSVNAIVASEEHAKKVFQVANSTVKISTEFSRALLSSMADAPGYLKEDRSRAIAVKSLALTDTNSPFRNIVKHPGAENKKAPIAYNSLFAVVATFDSSAIDFGDRPDHLAECTKRAFNIVKRVWPNAWGKSAAESKLTHGAGLRAMANVLKSLVETNYRNHDAELFNDEVWQKTEASIRRLATTVQWTDDDALIKGTKEQKRTYKEEILERQNTNQDIDALTKFLLKEVTMLEKNAKQKNS